MILCYGTCMPTDTKTPRSVRCPQCGAEPGKWCFPKHHKYEYEYHPIYFHSARHVAFELSQVTAALQPVIDRSIYLQFDADEYNTDPDLIADIKADVDACLAILGKYGTAWVA